MGREKTELELSETPQEQADRLRGALFAAYQTKDFAVAKKILWNAMGGKLHGYEPKPSLKKPE